MSVMEQLDERRKKRLLEHPHPLDRDAEAAGSLSSTRSADKVRTVLSLWDSCFYGQDPDIYRHEWSSLEHVGIRMYRELLPAEFDLLAKVVEASYDVELDSRDKKIIVDSHVDFVHRHGNATNPMVPLVVWNPVVFEETCATRTEEKLWG